MVSQVNNITAMTYAGHFVQSQVTVTLKKIKEMGVHIKYMYVYVYTNCRGADIGSHGSAVNSTLPSLDEGRYYCKS